MSAPHGAIAALILNMDGLLVDSKAIAEAAIRQFLLVPGNEMISSTFPGILGRRLLEEVMAMAIEFSPPR